MNGAHEIKSSRTPPKLEPCEKCGRAIVLSKFTLCYECRHQEKLDADVALDYLKEHRGASLAEVAMATGVDAQLILRPDPGRPDGSDGEV